MIAILCAREDSNYKKLPYDLDIWDIKRDMYNYINQGEKIIAHPPCAQWGNFKGMAYDNPREKKLGLICLEILRESGGILEHPANSDLVKMADFGKKQYVQLNWFGANMKKLTVLLYHKVEILPPPFSLDTITSSVEKNRWRRDETPIKMCEYLIKSVLNT